MNLLKFKLNSNRINKQPNLNSSMKTGKIEKPQKGKRVNEQEYDKIIEDFSRKMNNENK